MFEEGDCEGYGDWTEGLYLSAACPSQSWSNAV